MKAKQDTQTILLEKTSIKTVKYKGLNHTL